MVSMFSLWPSGLELESWPRVFEFHKLVVEAIEVNEAVEVSKAWKITTEDFRVNQDLSFDFILMFSGEGCWGQSLLIFWNLIDRT